MFEQASRRMDRVERQLENLYRNNAPTVPQYDLQAPSSIIPSIKIMIGWIGTDTEFGPSDHIRVTIRGIGENSSSPNVTIGNSMTQNVIDFTGTKIMYDFTDVISTYVSDAIDLSGAWIVLDRTGLVQDPVDELNSYYTCEIYESFTPITPPATQGYTGDGSSGAPQYSYTGPWEQSDSGSFVLNGPSWNYVTGTYNYEEIFGVIAPHLGFVALACQIP